MRIIKFINRLNARHKLWISLLFASIAISSTSFFVAQPMNWMVGWLVYSTVHVGLAWVTILSSHPAEVPREVHAQDSGRILIFLFVVVASFVSLFAILFLLQDARRTAPWSDLTLHVIVSFSCVICSWILVHTVFTLRYAHLYYRTLKSDGKNHQPSGLEFPNEPQPDYLDFTYFSFVIGMTFQVSDVTISSKDIRRLTLVHSLLSFAFNTLLVALTINVVSGLIQSKS
ncbi:DUF1345 domain-containing protein [Dyadobacter sp. CY261]|uniref:DUF1345 domain-containing protein n=1 Tax=Dyadobacter sp. CY261 TaxID=2907203 RepID=UPI001F1A874C|nr:DUF1345 domain-containing protein [Dyadobacter sp. CY261]MCF0074109.1 DUF1345 domain-containing protein [Dyadobacter sp. CY261]